jgi:hypothetical protein
MWSLGNYPILNSSKELAEMTTAERETVQFIHESVRDFLLKAKGLENFSTALPTISPV